MVMKNKMRYKNILLRKVEPYAALGYTKLESGSELFGLDKSIATEAWLHALYFPLSETEIKQIENILGKKLPHDLYEFYKELNGFDVFLSELTIYGFRKDFIRNVESAWQPFSIETINNKERPLNAPEDIIFIGSYSDDGTLVYINLKNSRVSTCDRDDATPKHTWNTLKEFLLNELDIIFEKYRKKYNV